MEPRPPLDTPSPRPDLEPLLRRGVAAARAGNRAAAQALFRALTREYPAEARAWLGLAGVAATREEQRAALEQARALDPDNPRIHQALERLPPPPITAEATTLVLPETVLIRTDEQVIPVEETQAPPQPEQPTDSAQPTDQQARRAHFPLMNMIAALVILALLGVVGVVIWGALAHPHDPPTTSTGSGQASAPTPLLQAGGPQATPAPAAPTTAATPAATGAPAVAAPTVAPTIPTGPTAGQPLPLGALVEYDRWSATLLRPDYALFLDGSLGDLRPNGRFVLALLAVSNDAPEPRRIPADLFVLIDNRGRQYAPMTAASRAYLDLYGRGQVADLALEEQLDPTSGMRTIPVLFDVPVDARGFTLALSGLNGRGWPIDTPSDAAPAGP